MRWKDNLYPGLYTGTLLQEAVLRSQGVNKRLKHCKVYIKCNIKFIFCFYKCCKVRRPDVHVLILWAEIFHVCLINIVLQIMFTCVLPSLSILQLQEVFMSTHGPEAASEISETKGILF